MLIEGARRIGKSTIVEEFARNEYKSYIPIDFAEACDVVKEAFEHNLNDLDTFFMLISCEYKVKLHERQSLIIFDEVQKYPRAREAVKYLVKDGRYDYIETGSLISIHENVADIVIPSEERCLRMYPLDFEEFCWAFGEEQLLDYIRLCFEKRRPLTNDLHRKAMMLFRQYLLVGGMPKPLSAYLQNGRDFASCDEEKRDILRLYREDIMKIGRQYRSKVLAIYDQIPGLFPSMKKGWFSTR